MSPLRIHRTAIALLLTAAALFTGCRDAHEEVQEEVYATSLQLTIRVNGDRRTPATRAEGDEDNKPDGNNPTGGEDGDGREQGYEREYAVTNATLLLYRDAAGINSTADPLIDYAFYAPVMEKKDKGDGKIYYTSEVLRYKTPLPRGTWHAIVLANLGDRTDLEGKPLSEVRDRIVEKPYTLTYDATTGMPDIDGATNFAMTSEKDFALTLGDHYGPNDVVPVNVPVERLAARIDFSAGKTMAGTEPDKDHAVWVTDKDINLIDGGTLKATGYMYAVVDDAEKKNDTGDRFILTHVTPFNCLTSGTYCIKRVTTDGKTFNFLGDEQTDGLGNATNYVIDPWLPGKTTTTMPAGLTYRNRLTATGDPLTDTWPVKNTGLFKPATEVNPQELEYYILDYTQENTLPPNQGKEHYATGLQFTGYYGSLGTDGEIKYREQTYRYYIRHTDPNGSNDEGLPMKYGIVRNNIYRIHINSVNSLGQITIVVNDWKRIEVDEIQI